MEFIVSIVVIILLAKLLSEPLRRIGIHVIVGDILAGLILGPAVLGLIYPDVSIKALADFSLIILMLYTGLNTNPRVLSEHRFKIIVTGVSGAFFTFILIFAAAYLYGYPLFTALFIAVALSNTATETVAAMIEKAGRRISSTIQSILIGASFVDDVLAIYLITLLRTLPVEGTFDLMGLAIITAKIMLFMLTVLYVSRILVEHHSDKILKLFSDPAQMTMTTVVLAFILALTARLVGLNEVIGAYLGGLAVSRLKTVRDPTLLGVIRVSELADELRVMLESLFTTIFFAYVGLNYNPLAQPGVLPIILFTTLALLGKFVGCTLPLLASRIPRHEVVLIGIGMGGRGALETAIILFAQQYGLIGPAEYATILTVMLGTAIVTPILFGLALKKYQHKLI